MHLCGYERCQLPSMRRPLPNQQQSADNQQQQQQQPAEGGDANSQPNQE